MDLIIQNPDKRPVSRYRAWIAYDPTIFEGEEVELSPEFPTPTPGETDFVSEEGYIKLSGTADEPVDRDVIVVARIKMRVIAVPAEGTPITFFDASGTTESSTGIFETDGSEETNMLTENPGFLYARLEGADTGSNGGASSSMSMMSSGTASSTGAMGGTTSSAASSVASSSTIFTLLQVQGVRVTTEGSSVFLAWDALPSSELVGYNVYYGTVSGRYIQRRGVDKDSTSLTLRALPVGTTYYFAVRGVNAANQETEFSQEVGISVGNPSTSTSPLTANSIPTKTPGTNGTVAGETGVSSVLLVLLVLSAVIGTGLAFRRQWGARSM